MATTNADPPTSAISASRSSTSRAGAYGGVSPLSPRPRRSYVTTVKWDPRSDASSAPAGLNDRCASAPSTEMIGCPLPARENAMAVPSFEWTLLETVIDIRHFSFVIGGMFWLSRKRLVGSYRVLIERSRSQVLPG